MKRIILAAVLGLGFGGMAAADPVDGTWKVTSEDTGNYLHVGVGECGSKVCGTIKAAFKKDGSVSADYEHLGKKMIWDMTSDGKGYYGSGKIWAPDTDKTYSSKMTLTGKKLVVKGCVAGGLICRSLTWTRVN